jgi:predicted SAM-dependent methyltransferase
VKQVLQKDCFFLKSKDPLDNSREYSLYKDETTGIIWTDIEHDQDHSKFYNSSNYIPHSNKKSLLGILYSFAQKLMFVYKLNIIKKHLQIDSKILDYGSGDSNFAKYLRIKKINIQTYDPLYSLIKNKKPQAQIIDNQVDMLMMWHVLEHIPNVFTELPKIRQLIKKKGFLVVAVPNINSLDAKFYSKYWAGLDVPRHLYHFNHTSLIQFLKREGFSLITKHPLPLDSYYVSMLSEKNKRSLFSFVNAIIIGSISNFFALFSTNFSSSVYIFRND